MRSIGIIGAGQLGEALARALASNGIAATLSNSRGPDSLRDVVAKLGPNIEAGTREEAARKELVIVAVNWSRLPEALGDLPDFGGRTVVDANNPIEPPRFRPAELQGRTSSEVFGDLVRNGRVVKAFNHLPPPLLASDPLVEGGRRVLFFAGDDAPAKAAVAELVGRLGFTGIDLGSLVEGGKLMQFPGGALTAQNFVRF